MREKRGKEDKERKARREAFFFLSDYYPNSCRVQDWADLNSEGGEAIQGSHVGVRIPVAAASSGVHWQKAGIGIGERIPPAVL